MAENGQKTKVNGPKSGNYADVFSFPDLPCRHNSVICHQKMLPKVANEKYCNLVLSFGVVWGNGVKG